MGAQSSLNLLIRNGRVVDPSQGLDAERDVLIEDGHVAAIESKIERKDIEIFDARGLIVAPGFIDLHVHLREPGQEGSETIETGTCAAAAGGFTSVCAMPNTQPVNDNAVVTGYIVLRARERGVVNVFPVGAASKESAGEELAELAAMRQAGIIAISDDGRPVATGLLMRRVMEYGQMLGLPVIDHCEDRSLTAGGVMNEGQVSLRLGLRGMPPVAETILVARDILLAELTGARLHIAHLSTRQALELVRQAKRRGLPVTCEVTPHHFTLNDTACESFDPNFKMNPPLRTAEDVAALVEGLADGTVDAIATDHAPHALALKQVEFDHAPFGVIGLETAVGLAFDRLYHTKKISRERLVGLFSTNPAKAMGLDRGTLGRGAVADVTILDPAREWTYDVEQSASKSHNSPFHGWKMRGTAVATIVAGKTVYRRQETLSRSAGK